MVSGGFAGELVVWNVARELQRAREPAKEARRMTGAAIHDDQAEERSLMRLSD